MPHQPHRSPWPTASCSGAAIVAVGLGCAGVVGTAMLRTAGAVVPLWMLVLPGVLWGTAFAVAILSPLRLVMRRVSWLQFGLPAIVLWAVISAAPFESRGLSPFEVIANDLMVLPAGFAVWWRSYL